MIDALPPWTTELPLEAGRHAAWRFQAGGVLGTRLDLIVEGGCAMDALAAMEAAQAEIARLDACLNWRRPDSELARLNASSSMVVSPDLFGVLERAAAWRRAADDAFDERLGAVSRLWREASPGLPDREALTALTDAARGAEIGLDPALRLVRRGEGAVIDLDAFAKGYVIDRALQAARGAAREAAGVLVAIGGDGAGWRVDGAGAEWAVGLPRMDDPADNAPVDAIARFATGGFATSGRGPRDVVCGGRRIGPAISAASGEPQAYAISASVMAGCAADADALATIALSLPPARAVALVDGMPGAAACIVDKAGKVWTSQLWRDEAPQAVQVRQTAQPKGPAKAPEPAGRPKWPSDWRVEFHYTAPERAARDRDFRPPYMAMWVTDTENRPIRTLYMIGREAKWQRDNFIWWRTFRDRAEEIVDLKSEATLLSGRYALHWWGYDDAEKRLPGGKYIIHLETSRERGKHTYRRVEIDIQTERFQVTLPDDPESGGFLVKFAHVNDGY